jgi:hypothetical protein
MTTDTHLQYLEDEISKIQERMKDREKQAALSKSAHKLDQDMLKVLTKGLAKMKEAK